MLTFSIQIYVYGFISKAKIRRNISVGIGGSLHILALDAPTLLVTMSL
jgi:hypothetical protein